MKLNCILLIAAAFISACHPDNRIKMLSSEGTSAESVFLTRNQHDEPVAVWTEKKGDHLTLLFAVSDDNGKSFSHKMSLPLTSDVATHAEGMPKVAFKNDGTILAAYEKKAPTKENKYAGAIYYVMSMDGGEHWSKEALLHSDTIAGRSRSYFDIERLPDGEIGASWLDIKLNNQTGGRSVRFAKTQRMKGFTNEILIDSSACQCCRIDLYADVSGHVQVAYRGLIKGAMGRSIRDMMLATSLDNGRTFSPSMCISHDNWAIDGCPHTGPSLCSSKTALYSAWYTEGNGTGVYYSFKQPDDSVFAPRQLVSSDGRHPQLSTRGSGAVMVWEEDLDQASKKLTRLCYQMNEGPATKKEYLTPVNGNAFVPVVAQTKNGAIIAFLMETEKGTGMFFSTL